jgi:hypothetical protein
MDEDLPFGTERSVERHGVWCHSALKNKTATRLFLRRVTYSEIASGRTPHASRAGYCFFCGGGGSFGLPTVSRFSLLLIE